ncbi:PadR family transcriptional regulator [Gordonia neofelifaecis]|uniref:Transcriptional regulator, PadR-like family protein n=1 Tax=Gordonia neofelifaecis NRRL B-59395 TaxID=644548 RepID=F1YFL9_9ACTN|nr:PadR family transcriptional regulator [Gordonia neofelifaecis]EGD56403.1 transcriptional regulator, PadR-like family protein [Gordonia neofelifaecis NRRL B-59395]
MALRHAILATLLTDGEVSGYDIAKGFDDLHARFWVAAPQQIYRELDKMEREEMILARVVEQEKRPNKRVFGLTDRGRRELAEFTRSDPRPTAIRDDLMVMVQSHHAGDAAAIRESIVARRAAAERKLEHYERIRAYLLKGRSEAEGLADPATVGPYLTLLRGLAFERENVEWSGVALRALDALDTADD